MKKLFGKITVLVMALMLSFALFACGDNGSTDKKGGNTGDDGTQTTPTSVTINKLVENTAQKMLAKNGFSADVSIELGMGVKVTLPGTLDVVKTLTDYDFAFDLPAAGNTTPQMGAIKKGTTLYLNEGGEWTQQDGEITLTLDSAMATVLGILSQVELDKVELKNGVYALSTEVDYGAGLQGVCDFISGNAQKTTAEVIAENLAQEGYTAEELIADVEAIFAQDGTLPEIIAAADVLMLNFGLPVTVESLIDLALIESGMTTEMLYDMFIEMEIPVDEPTAEQTPSEWLLEQTVVQEMTGEDLVEIIKTFIPSDAPGTGNTPSENPSARDVADNVPEGGEGSSESTEITFAGIGETVIAFLSEDFGTVYNMLASFGDDGVRSALNSNAAAMFFTKSVLDTWLANGNVLDHENLALLEFTEGGNKISVSITVNEDFTIKEMRVAVSSDVKYNGAQLTKFTAGITLTFDYSSVPVITAPQVGGAGEALAA